MKLHDPRRRRINDRPEFLGRRVVIPQLNIFPEEDGENPSIGMVRLSAMIPDDRNPHKFSARQVQRTVCDSDLPKIVDAYRDDPESTLETLFSISLAPVAEPSDRDFARDLRSSREEEDNPKEFRLPRTAHFADAI